MCEQRVPEAGSSGSAGQQAEVGQKAGPRRATKSTKTSIPIEPKAPNSAFCGRSKTFSPMRRRAAPPIAARHRVLEGEVTGVRDRQLHYRTYFDFQWRTRPQTSNCGKTAWARNLATPVRDFLGTETGSALSSSRADRALLWANVDFGSYRELWTPTSRSRSARTGSTHPARWVNEG